ncbi:MAG: hypothetical protein COB30_007710 [Ectothiorhodospiraceae bacterium]|nr:hypothetical protein [Ectothiorhodospiraceae bacterium]
MNFGARFSEFGMTGAVFWICQILLFTVGTGTGHLHGMELLGGFEHVMGLSSATTDGTPNNSSNHSSISPSVLSSAAGSLLTVFGLIGIFITGLILDMIGSIFFMQEMRIFGRHIHRNKDWLGGMTHQCSTAITKDYQDFLIEFDEQALSRKEKFYRLFKTSFHQQRYALGSQYRRLQTFMLSYIHAFSANGMSEQLKDHVHVWRTARSISTALFIVGIEAIFLIEEVRFEWLSCEGTNCSQPEWVSMLSIHLILIGLSAFLTLKSYNRMCYSLFTLTCATNSHVRNTSLQAAPHTPLQNPSPA